MLAVGLLVGGVAVPALAGGLGRRVGRRQADARGKLTAELVELLRGAPELVVFGREQDVLDRIRAADRVLSRLARRDALVAGLGDALSILVAGVTAAGVLASPFRPTTPGRSTACSSRCSPCSRSPRSTPWLRCPPPRASSRACSEPAAASSRWPTASRASAILLSLCLRPRAPRWSPSKRSLRATSPPSRPSFDDFDLRLEPGSRVALVGRSGAGKTTVTNLLLRFLDPEDGRVTLAGRDVRDYRQEDVRATFALAGQDAHLFNSTIRANLGLARPGATDGGAPRRSRQGADRRVGRLASGRARHARRRGRRAAVRRTATAAHDREGARLAGLRCSSSTSRRHTSMRRPRGR